MKLMHSFLTYKGRDFFVDILVIYFNLWKFILTGIQQIHFMFMKNLNKLEFDTWWFLGFWSISETYDELSSWSWFSEFGL